ncbi:hypothetical protein MMC07_006608 [Pseudocyphellaria aurata]|nr:hypothetical protein [Pseudocyphellaria aurata]
MQQQHREDLSSQSLAELFNRKISLSNPIEDNRIHLQQLSPANLQEQEQRHEKQQAQEPMQEPMQEQTPAVEQWAAPTANYSISQHYTHSAHVVNAINTQQAAKSTSNANSGRGLSIYQTLIQNNIPPASLLHSQLTLFEQADSDQRSRLMQLWSIAPPHHKYQGAQGQADDNGEYQSTTLEEEEARAWVRHQRHMSVAQQQNEHEQMDRSLFPLCIAKGEGLATAELYMTSGYEQLAQRDYQQQNLGLANVSPSVGLIFSTRYKPATDPTYQSKSWHPDGFGLQPMEHQYGIFDQINQLQAQAQGIVHIHEPEDEEML